MTVEPVSAVASDCAELITRHATRLGLDPFAAEAIAKAVAERISRAPAASGEALARAFHDTYERLAPSFGYETRADTRHFDPNSANGKLMIAVCSHLGPALPVRRPVTSHDELAARAREILRSDAYGRVNVISGDAIVRMHDLEARVNIGTAVSAMLTFVASEPTHAERVAYEERILALEMQLVTAQRTA